MQVPRCFAKNNFENTVFNSRNSCLKFVFKKCNHIVDPLLSRQCFAKNNFENIVFNSRNSCLKFVFKKCSCIAEFNFTIVAVWTPTTIMKLCGCSVSSTVAGQVCYHFI